VRLDLWGPWKNAGNDNADLHSLHICIHPFSLASKRVFCYIGFITWSYLFTGGRSFSEKIGKGAVERIILKQNKFPLKADPPRAEKLKN